MCCIVPQSGNFFASISRRIGHHGQVGHSSLWRVAAPVSSSLHDVAKAIRLESSAMKISESSSRLSTRESIARGFTDPHGHE